jgi:hypothetical protein
MASGLHGKVDFGEEGFIARFEYDPALVSQIKQIQRRRWLKDQAAWLVEPHWPSARRLLHIASELGWEITGQAREAEQRLKRESESLEYSVDVVHDSYGKAWFQCKVGDDDRLLQQVRAISGAVWDDSWWVPTDWEQCCGPLLEIVRADMRLEVSPAAWQLLEEQDVTHLFERSCAPPQAATPPIVQAQPGAPSPEAWRPTTQDRAMHALSSTTDGAARALAVGDAAAETAQTARKPRVSTRNKPAASPPAKKQVS